jgi:hypothetical protein
MRSKILNLVALVSLTFTGLAARVGSGTQVNGTEIGEPEVPIFRSMQYSSLQ